MIPPDCPIVVNIVDDCLTDEERKIIVATFREYYKGSQILFSYESVYQESDNAEQRERRRSFYLKNGFYETGWGK